MVDQQIARAQQQIDEVERAGPLLQLARSRRRRRRSSSCSSAARSAVGGALERVELGHQRLRTPPRRRRASTPAPYARSRPLRARRKFRFCARSIDARLPAVGIGGVEPLGGLDVVAQLAHGVGVQIQRIARRARPTRQSAASSCTRASTRSQLGVAIERVAPPRAVEVAPLGQLAAGPAKPLDRTVVVAAAVARPHAPPQRAPHAFGRLLELLVQPRVERLVEQPLGPRLGQHLEQRIDAGFDRPLAQQVGAEAVDRADVRLFEPLNGVGEVRARTSARDALPQALELLPDPQLQLARRLLGERDGDDLLDARAARRRARCRMRCTSSVVLPVPAAASTMTVSSRPSRIRSRSR